ncbi:MAG: DMT family transporter [Verrucomicrobia bacterium]|nr:DMT family transporter [Verrucomicrobiota bacterium]
MFAAFLATLLFSLSVVAASRTTRALGGTTANFYRLCLATTFLALWAHGVGQGLGGGAFGWFFVSGVVGFGMGDLALYQALPRLGPRLTILMVQCLAAPFAALTEWLWMGTRLSPGQLLAGLVILAGVAIAVAPREHLHLPRRALMIGLLLGVVAALGQGLGAVISRKAYAMVELNGGSVDGMTAAYQRILGGLLFTAPYALAMLTRDRWRAREGAIIDSAVPAGSRPGRSIWIWVVVNSLAGPTVGVGCYQWALATQPSGVVLPIVATTPIAVIPFAYLVEGDRPSLRSVVGGIVAVGGAIALTLIR